MPKGKYARRAEIRQDRAETASTVTAYREKVVRLAAENRELREALDTERTTNKQVQRRLRAERDEGVGPQVEALKRGLEAMRAERDAARRELEKARRQWMATASRITTHFRDEHGATGVEPMEALMNVMAEEGEPQPRIAYGVPTDIGVEKAERIQRARGLRR